jgi:beta-lactamase regulating signal transducer with metallopeptidase domain
MNPHMEALGFTLVHFCWQAALIAAVYKGLELALPKLRPQARYMMSLTALLAMLAAAALTFVYEEMRLFQAALPAANISDAVLPEISRQLHLSALLPWFDAVWLIGVAALSFRMLAGLWQVHGLKKQAQPAPDSVQYRFKAALRRFGLTGKVQIRLHPAITGPFVVGAFRSVVYLPLSAVTSLSPEQLDAVLSHELEHIRRADYVWNLIQSLIETLFFYHPAVWWIGGKLREQRELCCDDAAIRSCDDPITYATALLSLEEQRRGVPNLSMALNGQGKSDLLARISRILGEKPDSRLKARPVAFVLLPVMLLTLTAFAAAPVREVAAKICPQSAATANTALAKLETVMAGNSDQMAQVSDIQAAKSDFEASQSDRQASMTDWQADNIDPDAIAAEARADAIKARAEMARAREIDIDPQALAAQARAEAVKARAEMERAGLTDHQIDPDAIAAQVLAETQRAKADVARLAMEDINPDQIAAQARAGAMQARAQIAAHKAEIARAKAMTRPMPPRAPVAPLPPLPPVDALPMPEVPAPLASPEDVPPPPPVPSLSSLNVFKGMPTVRNTVMVANVATPRPVPNVLPLMRLNQLPNAAAAPIPAPDPKTDVIVNVRTNATVKIVTTKP